MQLGKQLARTDGQPLERQAQLDRLSGILHRTGQVVSGKFGEHFHECRFGLTNERLLLGQRLAHPIQPALGEAVSRDLASIPTWMAAHAKDYGVTIKHTEDEIAALVAYLQSLN